MGKFVIKPAKGGGVMFNLLAANSQVVATSEVYAKEASCRKGIASVQKNAPIAKLEDQTEENAKVLTNPKFEMFLDKAGKIRFRLKARNGEIIATSQAYKSKKAALNGIESVRTNAAEAEIVKEAAE
jgi:uncharacterized protein YegP (UPF0339 family)